MEDAFFQKAVEESEKDLNRSNPSSEEKLISLKCISIVVSLLLFLLLFIVLQKSWLILVIMQLSFWCQK